MSKEQVQADYGQEQTPQRRRRAQYITPVDRNKADPFAPQRTPVDYRKKADTNGNPIPPGPNDGRLLREVPPHFGRL